MYAKPSLMRRLIKLVEHSARRFSRGYSDGNPFMSYDDLRSVGLETIVRVLSYYGADLPLEELEDLVLQSLRNKVISIYRWLSVRPADRADLFSQCTRGTDGEWVEIQPASTDVWLDALDWSSRSFSPERLTAEVELVEKLYQAAWECGLEHAMVMTDMLRAEKRNLYALNRETGIPLSRAYQIIGDLDAEWSYIKWQEKAYE